MNTILIDDPDDPRVAAYRNIRERDLTEREGRFVAEGKVVLNVLFRSSRFSQQSALIMQNRLEGMRQTLDLAPPEMPIYVASSQVMDAIAGFHIHRGILAIGRRRASDSARELIAGLPERALVVVLVGISNHDNVGAIFRNAAAFGANAVLLDDTSCNPLYRKAIRVSVGAVLKVPFATVQSAADQIAALRSGGFALLALSPRGENDIRSIGRPDRIALVLGAEGDGLPEALMADMPTARIAMVPDFDSLNVATASAIALHELSDRSAR